MKGYILLYRSIYDHWVSSDPKYFFRWCDLLMLAAYQRKIIYFEGAEYTQERGQVISSQSKLALRWRTNNDGVKDFLNKLKRSDMVTCVRKGKATIITVCNYDRFQIVQKDEDFDPYSDGFYSPQSSEKPARNSAEKKADSSYRPSSKRSTTNKNIEDNNIINNPSQQSVREENLKFFEEMKNAEISLDEMTMRFSCTKQELLEMLDAFVKEVNIKETRHNDFSDFRKHFFDWARIQFDKKREYENRRNKSKGGTGGTAQDKYAARRGTDVGGKSESDYGSSF